MRKFLFVIFLLITSYDLFAFTTQGVWRWRNDNGSEISATWKAAQGKPILISNIDTILRLRIELYNNTNSNLLGSVLQDSIEGGAGWETIDLNQGAKAFALAGTSPFIADQEATTSQLKGQVAPFTFVPGKAIVSSEEYPSQQLVTNQRTEIEYVIKPTASVHPNATYFFRVYVSNYTTGYVFPYLFTNCNIMYDGITHNKFTSAVTVPLNKPVNGTINSATDSDFYKFTITTEGTGKITLSTLPADYDLYVYSSAKKQIAVSKRRGTKSEMLSGNFPKGTFYIKIVGFNGAFNSTSCYTLNVTQGTLLNANVTASKENVSFIKNDFALFPNPVSSILNISLPSTAIGGQVKITDVLGKIILAKTINSFRVQVNVNKFTSGTYFVTILNKDGCTAHTSKFVKE